MVLSPLSSAQQLCWGPGGPVLAGGAQLTEEQKLAVFSLKPSLPAEKGVGSAGLPGEDLPSAVPVLSWCLPPPAGCAGVYWGQLGPKCLKRAGSSQDKAPPYCCPRAAPPWVLC